MVERGRAAWSWWIALLVVALVGGLSVNVLAYRHAQAFTRFAAAGERTPKPEELSWPQRLAVLVTGPVLPRPANTRTPEDVGLAFETLRLRSRDGVGLEAWWIPAPDSRGSAALFHGYADSKDSLLREARAFHELGLEVLLLDFRGSGGSEGRVTTLGYREAYDVAAAVAHLAARGQEVVCFGASMGAVAVIRAVAEEDARCEALVLQAPFERLRTTLARRFQALGVPAFPAADLLLLWGGQLRGFDAGAWDPIELAPQIVAPTLVLHGAEDARVHVEDVRALVAAFGGPTRLELFPGLGHASLVRGDPERWQRALSGFLPSPRRPGPTDAPAPAS